MPGICKTCRRASFATTAAHSELSASSRCRPRRSPRGAALTGRAPRVFGPPRLRGAPSRRVQNGRWARAFAVEPCRGRPRVRTRSQCSTAHHLLDRSAHHRPYRRLEKRSDILRDGTTDDGKSADRLVGPESRTAFCASARPCRRARMEGWRLPAPRPGARGDRQSIHADRLRQRRRCGGAPGTQRVAFRAIMEVGITREGDRAFRSRTSPGPAACRADGGRCA